MPNSRKFSVKKISAYAFLAGMSTVSLNAIADIANATAEVRVNSASHIAHSSTSLFAISNATTVPHISASVHHSLFGSVSSAIGSFISGTAHIAGSIVHGITSTIRETTHVAGSLITGTGNAIQEISHTEGSIIEAVPHVAVPAIFGVKAAILAPINLSVSVASTGLKLVSQASNFLGNIISSNATTASNLLSTIGSTIGNIGGFFSPTFHSIATSIDSTASNIAQFGDKVRLTTSIITPAAGFAGQILPKVVKFPESLLFGPGRSIDSAIGNFIGDSLGGTISTAGALVGGIISGVGHVLTALSTPNLPARGEKTVTHNTVNATISPSGEAPQVSIL